MNDFTKDELQYLLEMIDSIRIVNRSINDDELQEKIQTMIDSYCEHEETEVDVDGGISLICANCRETLVDVM